MNILASKCKNVYSTFHKELYTDILDNLKIMTGSEFEESDGYKKVVFAAYLRTDTDNLVLTFNDGDFLTISEAPQPILSGLYPNILNDICLLCGKDLIDSAFTVSGQEALFRLVGNSVCYPVGAVEMKDKYVVALNVVVSSKILVDSEISLNSGYYFMPIETLEAKDSLQKSISDSLVIVI